MGNPSTRPARCSLHAGGGDLTTVVVCARWGLAAVAAVLAALLAAAAVAAVSPPLVGVVAPAVWGLGLGVLMPSSRKIASSCSPSSGPLAPI